jgi:hypothetical protein
MFIVSLLTLIAVGVLRGLSSGSPTALTPSMLPAQQALTGFLVLRAFASGCAALTGIEAVANGVQAFRHPAPKHAVQVLTALAFLLLVMFIGVTWLAHGYHVIPAHNATAISQVAEHVFGRSWMYYVIQFATSIILFLAANTSFAGFPRLASLLARDGYLPRQLANVGDRLVFNNGILLLAATAIFLVVIFGGMTHALIPLYAVGVFLAFTLSQSGMVVRWWRNREPGWRSGIVINAIGAVTTFVVLAIILVVKFVHGAWMVTLLLPVMVLQFRSIRKHYEGVAELLQIDAIEKLPVRPTRVIVPVAGLHKGVLRALRFALGLRCPVRAIHVGVDATAARKLQEQWQKLETEVPLDILASPYRSLAGPLLEYVDKALAEDPEAFVAVIIPEFVPAHWAHAVLHNQSAVLLQFALRSRPNAVLISVRYLLAEAAREAENRGKDPEAHVASGAATPPVVESPSAAEDTISPRPDEPAASSSSEPAGS